MKRIGIYGATGYTGLELARILARHPGVEVSFVTSEREAGGSLRASWPQAPDWHLVSANDAPLGEVDFVFLCLPHTKSAQVAAMARAADVRVIDLSADLRLDTPERYARWYHGEHPAPELLPAPYGLPELVDRASIAAASAVANPGCYATTALLALVPLARAGLILPGTPLIVDAKSGVSGAGRAPKQNILFAELHGNFYPYSIGREHRHVGEIEQMLAGSGIEEGRLIFSPHLLPTDRGIVATSYVQVSSAVKAGAALREAYAGEPLVRLLAAGEVATLNHVVRTPGAVISVHPVSEQMLIVVSALDNLLKGASSQAVQNFNLMAGYAETEALPWR